jgi:hypothetical protein
MSYMGIDQMGGFNAVIIKERLPDGRQALIHAEAIFDQDPFARCEELLKQFSVAVCVVEGLPNWNDAKRFANRNSGRVFVASYGDQQDTMVWGDQIARNDRKTGQEDRDRYVVRLNQYKAMQTALARITDGHLLFPDPSGLEVDYRDGVPRRVLLLRDIIFEHLTRVALISERDPETARWKTYVKKVGLDPHYAYANMLCDVAWARSHGTASFIIPSKDKPSVPQQSIDDVAPGLPVSVSAQINAIKSATTKDGSCGACQYYDGGTCLERGFRVRGEDHGCVLFMRGQI